MGRARRYIALLRAINVGGRTVKMDRLRQCFESMGFENVETFIASGNVIFETAIVSTPTIENRIEQHLVGALGYEVGCFVRSPSEVRAAAQHQAFPPFAEPFAVSVGFLPDEPSAAACNALSACQTLTDEFRVRGREFYWLCRTRTSDSKVTGKQLERAIGMPFTMRNVTTVRRLSTKYSGES